MLVTSRKRPAASEEVVLRVAAPPKGHAVELFVRLSGRPAESLERAVVQELVGLCGCLPLVISLLAARLGTTRRGVRTICAAVFSCHATGWPSYARARRRWPRRSSCPTRTWTRSGSASSGSWVSTLGPTSMPTRARPSLPISVAEARSRLEELYEAHLIDEQLGDRYRLHHLLRDYARRAWLVREAG